MEKINIYFNSWANNIIETVYKKVSFIRGDEVLPLIPFTAMALTSTRTSQRSSMGRELLRRLMTTLPTDRLLLREISSSRCSGAAK